MKIRWSELWIGAEAPEMEPSGALDGARVRALVRERTGTAGRRRSPWRVLLAAAALTGALTLAAGAVVHYLGAGTLFADYFGREEAPVTTEQAALIDELGTTFENGVTSNGTTITPLAAIADENVYYLRLQIEAPVGTVLPEYDNETDGWYQLHGPGEEELMTISRPEGNERKPWGWTCEADWLPDPDPADNRKEVVLVFHSMAGADLKFNNGTSRTLTIRGLWLQSPDKGYTELLRGEWTFDIGLHFESETISLEVDGLTRWDEFCQVPVTLEEARLSPLTLFFRISYPETDGRWPGPGLQVVMKDGTTPEFKRDGSGELGSTGAADCLSFDVPIDLAQVDYILFGTEKIYLPQG